MNQYILIFDIGKTNKKCLLFDSNFMVRDKKEIHLSETLDEDEFPCEDLHLLTQWIKDTFDYFWQLYGTKIRFLNFSTYGASFVHLDKNNDIILPLYNYLKPIQKEYFQSFYKKYGGMLSFSKTTASPALGFLNAGLQLFWIKKEKPEIFQRIKTSLHFPNYCSYLFHGNFHSEYTSIGCHTALWDYEKMDYHDWVKNEQISPKLPIIIEGNEKFPDLNQVGIQVGIGLHDSSAALVPYLYGVDEKFILISTGTWSITLNPFNEIPLTPEELQLDCLQFLTVKGQQVKASRLFLGNEFNLQITQLNSRFSVPSEKYQEIDYNEKVYQHSVQPEKRYYSLESLGETELNTSPLTDFESYEHAYYQLCYELVQKQIAAYHLAKGNSQGIQTVFIDGGFSNNDVFCRILARELPEITLKKTKLAAGSSLGAAIVMQPELFTRERFMEILDVEEVRSD